MASLHASVVAMGTVNGGRAPVVDDPLPAIHKNRTARSQKTQAAPSDHRHGNEEQGPMSGQIKWRARDKGIQSERATAEENMRVKDDKARCS